MPKESIFSDKYVKLYSMGCSLDGDPIVNLIEKEICLEFDFKFEGDGLVSAYKLINYSKDSSEDDTRNYDLKPDDNFIHLRFGNIYVDSAYRNRGICSYIMIKIIFTIISEYPKSNFLIDLKNTSWEIENRLKLYSSVLNESSNDWQYRFFAIENREHDIQQLSNQLNEKKKQIDSNF